LETDKNRSIVHAASIALIIVWKT